MLFRIESNSEFMERVHPLFSVDMEEMGLPIVGDTPLGFFLPPSLPRLADFCVRNPAYHIVSRHGDLAVNAAIPGSSLYLLADGCSDPRLVYDPNGKIISSTYRSLYAAFNRRPPNLRRSA